MTLKWVEAFHLLRKNEDEKEIPCDVIAQKRSQTQRILEFGINDELNPHLSCTIEVDEETFRRMKVGKSYWINMEEAHYDQSERCEGLGSHTLGAVRLMPNGAGMMSLCRSCWEGELYCRIKDNLELSTDEQWELPDWESGLRYVNLQVKEGPPQE